MTSLPKRVVKGFRRATVKDKTLTPDKIAAGWWAIVGWAGMSIVALSVVLFAIQCLDWLRYGYWPDWTLLDIWFALGFGEPGTDWVGANKIIFTILGLPAFLVVGVAGYALAAYGESRLRTQHRLENPD